MKILKRLFSLIIFIFFMIHTSTCYCQGLFLCEDTPFESNLEPSILKSRYHLFQIFGDINYRHTNIYKDNYIGSVAWTENRLFFSRFSEFIETSIPLPDPYLIGIFKGLKDINWEDRWDYGIGIEWRPLKHTAFPKKTFVTWALQSRFYVAYYKTIYLQNRKEWDWRPNDDFRIGMELYRECNLYNNNRYWGEIWADYSWRKTNFYINNYKNWTFACVPKWGIKLFSNKEFVIMPYVTAELAITGHREFWQNRALFGFGIRFMPFRWHDGIFGVLMRGTKFYIEGIKVVNYFKDKAPPHTSNCDFRIGINYTIINW